MVRYFVLSSLILLLFGCSDDQNASIEASGTLEAVEVNVSSRVSGQLLKLPVSEGTKVAKGDTIAILDDELLQIQLRQAEAGVDAAEAQYKLLLNGAREEDLQLAEENLTQARTAYASAEADFQRIKDLYAQRSVSQKQYEDAESRLTITRAQWNAARQNLQKMQNFARPEDLRGAKARVAQVRSQVDLIKKQIRDSYIISPVAGTIVNKPIEVGELIGVGSVIVKIAQLQKMELMIYVNEMELGKVKIGGKADVMIDTYPDNKYPGTVVYISPIAEFTPRNIQTKDERTKLVFGVKLEVSNATGDLKSGMPADALLY